MCNIKTLLFHLKNNLFLKKTQKKEFTLLHKSIFTYSPTLFSITSYFDIYRIPQNEALKNEPLFLEVQQQFINYDYLINRNAIYLILFFSWFYTLFFVILYFNFFPLYKKRLKFYLKWFIVSLCIILYFVHIIDILLHPILFVCGVEVFRLYLVRTYLKAPKSFAILNYFFTFFFFFCCPTDCWGLLINNKWVLFKYIANYPWLIPLALYLFLYLQLIFFNLICLFTIVKKFIIKWLLFFVFIVKNYYLN